MPLLHRKFRKFVPLVNQNGRMVTRKMMRCIKYATDCGWNVQYKGFAVPG